MPAVSSFVSDVTDTRLIPKVVDNIYDGNVLTMRLSRNNRRTWDKGSQITFPVYLSAVTLVGSYSGFDTLTLTQETKTVKAAFDPSQVRSSIPVSGIQLAVNQSGDAGVIDLIASELNIAAEALRQELGTEVYGDKQARSVAKKSSLIREILKLVIPNKHIFPSLSFAL